MPTGEGSPVRGVLYFTCTEVFPHPYLFSHQAAFEEAECFGLYSSQQLVVGNFVEWEYIDKNARMHRDILEYFFYKKGMLKAKLYMLRQEEQAAKAAGIRGDVKDNGWGSQIRSYVLQPYTMVKDLRTGEETGNVDAVLDGGLDPFISAYLRWMSLGCPDRNSRTEY